MSEPTTVQEQANEKRKLIVTTNNLGASHVYKEGVNAPVVMSQNSTQLSKTDIKPAVKYVPQKESFGSKLKKAIFGTEHIDNIPEYLVLKVAVPALKATFYDMFCAGLGMAFGMERKGGKKSGYTGYFGSGSSSRDRDEEDDIDERRPNSYRDIGFLTESDANEVYDVMLDYVRDQGYCTVLEFYGIADREDPNRRRDDRMGWDKNDLRNPRIFKSRGRWYIDLPRPTHLDNLG